jgi:hypothetical protein
MMTVASGLIEFFHVLPAGNLPIPSDPSVHGSIPLRAFKYCEPLTTANGFGWLLFPPVDFDLRWDGYACYWRRPTDSKWTQVQSEVLPEMREGFREQAEKTGTEHFNFPFLSQMAEYGYIQIWSGLSVRTQPGWVSLVRPLVNTPHADTFDVLEGIIETDWWIGPLLSVVRIKKTDAVVEFRAGTQYAQLQLVKREAYSEQVLKNPTNVAGLESWPTEVWRDFQQFMRDCSVREKPGAYKRQVRERRA